MSLPPFGSAPPNRSNIYSPADYIVAPVGAGHKADYYTTGTNDHTQINAAINAAAALSHGGTVEIINGTYTLGGSIVPKSNVWIRGQGMFTTKITTGSNATFPLVSTTSVYSIPSNPWSNAILSDMELDGSNLGASGYKGLDGHGMQNVILTRLYVHDTTASGLGHDYPYNCIVSDNLIINCGYVNKKVITAASWSSSTLTFTTATNHNYSIGSAVVIAGMVPVLYNGVFKVTSIIDATNFTIGLGNNAGNLTLGTNPGTATTFGTTSDSNVGHNGIGIASGGLATESVLVTNNLVAYSQNNNYLIEADAANTGPNASYIFANNISLFGASGGFRNSITKNAQFLNNYDYGSYIGGHISTFLDVWNINAASWSTGTASYTTTTSHSLSVGNYVVIQNMTPSGYNGYYYVTAVPDNTHFSVAITNNPGTATVFGKVNYVPQPTEGTVWENNIFLSNLYYAMQVEPYCDGYMLRGNTFANCTERGLYLQASRGSVTHNRIYGHGVDGVYVLVSANYIGVDHMDFSGNHVYNNGQNNPNGFDGLRLESSSAGPMTNLTVSGNHFFDNQQNVATQRYGILLKSSGNNSNHLYANNVFSGNATAPVLMQDTTASNIIMRDNVGIGATTSKTGNYTATVTDSTILVDSTSAVVTITLPDATLFPNKQFTVKDWKGQSATHNITIATTSAQTIDGASSLVLSTNYLSYTVASDGSNWSVI